MSVPASHSARLAAFLLMLGAPLSAAAGSYVPANDAVVLESLVAGPRAPGSDARELRALRAGLAAAPSDPGAAVAFARRAIELGRQAADPRDFGYAESALRPWWALAAPPEDVRLLRATLRQQRHDFAGALVDLDALVAADGSNAQARLTRAVVAMVQGRPSAALHDCAGLIGRTGLLTMSACIAQAQSLMGDAAAGPRLEAVIDDPHTVAADAGERVWALTVAGELAQRRGDRGQADRRFEAARGAAQAAGLRDPYLLTADADRLLDERRYAEVRRRLADAVRIDNALLRLALAEQALEDPALDDHRRLLQARFEETRQRGDTVHLREESLFELRIKKDASAAAALAARNWETQREPIDARLLAEAALAAGTPERAAPILGWVRETGIADPALLALVDRLRAAGVRP